MHGTIRLALAVGRVNSGNPSDCLEEITQVLEELAPQRCDITVFPRLALCSPSCGSLLLGETLPDQCRGALETLMNQTADTEGYMIVGLPVDNFGCTVSAMAVLHRGKLVALVPTLNDVAPLSQVGCSELLVSPDTVFACGKLRFCVLGCEPSTLAARAEAANASGCDLIIVPAYSPVCAGYIDNVRLAAKALSGSAGCAVAVVNGGVGDTSSPWIYQGFAAVYEAGEELAFVCGSSESLTCIADLDTDILRACKKNVSTVAPLCRTLPQTNKPGFYRPLHQNPWLPQQDRERYLRELFELQVQSLATRMQNIGITRLVIGISGGLDSTAALLCCAGVCDRLGLPRKNIVGVTMPGFGTSDHTYYNALALLEKLGATRRDISIRAAVQQHFEDIGHGGRKDVVYENAQARERTQILMDIANGCGGIVVGTGDLSEAALGFCTFGGDQIANFNVNVCITKTVLRELTRYVVESGRIQGVTDLVIAVLDTPISPELLPPGEAGEIQQKTEDILGPYLLHDFFLYHFIRYHFRPRKLYAYACQAFAGEFAPAYIREKLRLFCKRFCAAQFKRVSAPDSASITTVNLNNINFSMPSDLDPSTLLREVDELTEA